MLYRNMAKAAPLGLLSCVAVCLLFASGCATGRPGNPITKLRENLNAEPEYSVILADMKQSSGITSTRYYHQYQIVTGMDTGTTSWTPVSREVYERYQSLLGMTILSKTPDGEVTETPYPPGYQYVGNTKYGHWERGSGGTSFWVFYGQYALFRNIFGMGGRTIYRGDYDNYRTHYQQRRPYYGPNREYGTTGTHTKQQRPSFYQRKMQTQARSQERFSNKVQKRVGRSRTGYRARSGGFGK